MRPKEKKVYYYLAYDLQKDGHAVGIAYQEIGVRGGKKTARWFEPVRRRVTASEFKRYKFHASNMPASGINWMLDMGLHERGLHIESKGSGS